MEHLGVLLLIPLTRVSPSQDYPDQQHANSGTYLYTYCSLIKERHSGEKFLVKENNTMARLVNPDLQINSLRC